MNFLQKETCRHDMFPHKEIHVDILSLCDGNIYVTRNFYDVKVLDLATGTMFVAENHTLS